jgi:hypothetical protein
MSIERAKAITILSEIVSVNFGDTTPCDAFGCDERKCLIQATCKDVLESNFEYYSLDNLSTAMKAFRVEGCAFPVIQKLARQYIQENG